MESLEKTGRIDRSLLSGEHYLSSLLEQAYAQGVLTGQQAEAVQMDCLTVLAHQIQRYTGADSSSVRTEEAEGILESVLFTVGICLKEYHSPDDAANALVREGAQELFVRGRARIDRLLKTTRLLHAQIARRLLETPNVFYRSTLVDGIAGFWKLYRPDFAAQDSHITLDYPLLCPVSGLAGVELIREYLERFDCENQFCLCFSAKAIHSLLCGLPVDYRQLPLNLCEPVLAAALGCALCRKSVRPLCLTACDLTNLKNSLGQHTRSEILPVLKDALGLVETALSLTGRVSSYLASALPGISVAVETALETNTLEQVFLLMPQLPEP